MVFELIFFFYTVRAGIYIKLALQMLISLHWKQLYNFEHVPCCEIIIIINITIRLIVYFLTFQSWQRKHTTQHWIKYMRTGIDFVRPAELLLNFVSLQFTNLLFSCPCSCCCLSFSFNIPKQRRHPRRLLGSVLLSLTSSFSLAERVSDKSGFWCYKWM